MDTANNSERSQGRGRRLSTDRPGQSMVEFALMGLVLFLLLMGVFDLGRSIYVYIAINNAAREGVRYASVLRDAGSSGPPTCDEIKIRVHRFLSGVALDQPVRITSELMPSGKIDPVTGLPILTRAVQIEIIARFSPITPIISNIVGNSFTMTARSAAPPNFNVDQPGGDIYYPYFGAREPYQSGICS